MSAGDTGADSHDEHLDAELARIEADAEVAKANARGQRKGGGKASKPASPSADDRPGDRQSWDEFWAEVQREEAADADRTPTTVIRGVEVPIPHDLPLKFDRMLEQVEDSEADEDVHDLVAQLFGDDVFDKWADAGMSGKEFRVVLLWGIGNGRGRSLTFREAYEGVQSEGKSLAPPQNRTERRASERSGGQSKRTSGASTGSRRGK